MLKGNSIRYIVMFVVLVLLQVLVFNRISILDYATPFLYIYLIIKLPIGLNRNISLVVAFLLGFIIDMFCNTPGINAAATVLTAFVYQPIQGLFFTVDDYDEQIPRLSLLGSRFMKYAVLIIFIHHLVLISLESFSYFNFKIVVLRILSSTILTSLLIFGFEGLSTKKKNSWQKMT